MAVFEGFGEKPTKNTFDNVPFLLVRFLWAIKENDQDKTVNSNGFKTSIMVKQAFEACIKHYFFI